jgi:hypothetical protein
MTNMSASAALIMLLTIAMGCARSEEEANRPRPDADRIHSSNGFSFLPPQGSDWTEKFGESEILYLKQTDQRTVSFYAGALEGRIVSQVDTDAALLAFVRAKKDQWGVDGRYFDTSSSFRIEEQQRSCVRYSLAASDRGAKNKERLAFLTMQVFGRFCVHPENRTTAVDVYYSVRHPPSFDARPFLVEGETFLDSLQFARLAGGSK